MRAARAAGGPFEMRRGSAPRSLLCAGDDESVAVAAQGQARQRVAGARARRAIARGRFVERAVRGADERAAVLGEEVVRPEIERCADVRAAVDVRVVLAVVVDDESFYAAAAPQPEFRRPAGRQRGG